MSEMPRVRSWPIWITLLVTLCGLPVYMATAHIPWARSTGGLMFAVMLVGVVAGLTMAAKNRKWWVRGVAGVNVLLTAFMAFGLFYIARLPADPAFAALATAPDFTLNDELDRPVSLAGELSKGPVHLVFYRGHW